MRYHSTGSQRERRAWATAGGGQERWGGPEETLKPEINPEPALDLLLPTPTPPHTFHSPFGRGDRKSGGERGKVKPREMRDGGALRKEKEVEQRLTLGAGRDLRRREVQGGQRRRRKGQGRLS